MQTTASPAQSVGMMPAIISSARHLSAGDENLIETLANLRMLTNYIWGFIRTYGGSVLASIPEQERRELLVGAYEMNQLLLEISAGLNRLSVRSVLLKFASLKTVQVFQDAAERYDDFVESLRMSLNEELLEAISSQAPSSH